MSSLVTAHPGGAGHAVRVAGAVCGRGMRRISARPTLIMPVLLMPLFLRLTGKFDNFRLKRR